MSFFDKIEKKNRLNEYWILDMCIGIDMFSSCVVLTPCNGMIGFQIKYSWICTVLSHHKNGNENVQKPKITANCSTIWLQTGP